MTWAGEPTSLKGSMTVGALLTASASGCPLGLDSSLGLEGPDWK